MVGSEEDPATILEQDSVNVMGLKLCALFLNIAIRSKLRHSNPMTRVMTPISTLQSSTQLITHPNAQVFIKLVTLVLPWWHVGPSIIPRSCMSELLDSQPASAARHSLSSRWLSSPKLCNLWSQAKNLELQVSEPDPEASKR